VLKDHILKACNLLRNQTDTVFDDMKKVIKKAHRQAVPAVKVFLEKMYEHCASESGESRDLHHVSEQSDVIVGRGLYERNKKYIQETMRKKGVKLHEAGTRAIRAELDELLDSIPTRLAIGNNLVLRHIREEIKLFFDRNSTEGVRNSRRRVVSNAKLLLQKDLLKVIDDLAKDWKTKVVVEEIPDDDETEEEMALNDDLFVDLSKDDDDEDYEYNSDGEAD
jgi:hypothetical protein